MNGEAKGPVQLMKLNIVETLLFILIYLSAKANNPGHIAEKPTPNLVNQFNFKSLYTSNLIHIDF
jgi:hypothetical protein